MELKLNVYKGRKVVKTYTEDTLFLTLGTVEDVLNAIDFENMRTGDGMELTKAVLRLGQKNLVPVLMDIFEGLTADEARNTNVMEIVNTVFLPLIELATGELRSISSKN